MPEGGDCATNARQGEAKSKRQALRSAPTGCAPHNHHFVLLLGMEWRPPKRCLGPVTESEANAEVPVLSSCPFPLPIP